MRWLTETPRLFCVALFLVAGVLNVPAAAQGPGPDSDIEPDAMAVLMRMATFLAGAQRFSVTVDASYDAMQAWGQKVEFGAARHVTVRRPDRIRVDVVDRDGSRSGVRYDGQAISVFQGQEKVHAVAPLRGTLDEAMTYFAERLEMRLPGREVLHSELPRRLQERVKSARTVGTEVVGGVRSHHLALRTDDVDIQVWIARDGSPLLRRLVITYRRVRGMPEFRADLTKWNFSPQVPDSLFAFTPPAGSERIPFVPRRSSSGAMLPTGGAR